MREDEVEYMILKMKDSDLSKKIEENFMITKNERSQIIVDNKKILMTLDDDIRDIGIARIDALIEKTKSIAVFSTFISVIALAYTIMSKTIEFQVNNLPGILLGVFFTAGMLGWFFIKERKELQIFVFFKNLLVLSKKKSS